MSDLPTFPILSTGSCRGVCAWVSALVSCDSLYLPTGLFNFGGSGLPGNLTSLTHLRRADFSVCLAFYLLWEETDNFELLKCWT